MSKLNRKLVLYISLSIVFIIKSFAYDADSKESAIESYLRSLKESQRISQLFLVNIEGNTSYHAVEDTDDLYGDSSREPLVPGGCLMFSYNIADDAGDMIDFNKSIADYCDSHSVLRPYIAIDQEGGLVNRLRKITSPLPGCQRVSESLTPEESYKLYSMQSRQMKALGFDMNLSPVVEPKEKWNSDFLGTRSFGNAASSIVYSLSCVRAYENNGIGSVIKHFPGNTNTDPHTGLPEIKSDRNNIYKYYILPFAFIMQGNPEAVLMSHARVMGLDEKTPACLSHFWVTDVLRNTLGYQGLVISDDIFMGALADNGFPPEKAALKAIEAGVDVIMLSEKKFADVAAFLLKEAENNKDFRDKLYEAEKRVIKFKISKGILGFREEADGSLILVPLTFEAQNGSKTERITDYNRAYESGLSFYRAKF